MRPPWSRKKIPVPCRRWSVKSRILLGLVIMVICISLAHAGVRVVSPQRLYPDIQSNTMETPREQMLKMQLKEHRHGRNADMLNKQRLESIGMASSSREGSISGTITAPACPGDCMYNVDVMALDTHGILVDVGYATINGEGTYEINGIPDGDYYIFTYTMGWDDDTHVGELVHEFYNNTTDWDQSTLVSVSGGTASGVDFDLDSNSGFVEATVRNASGQPLANTMVMFDLYPYPPEDEDEIGGFFIEQYMLQRNHMTDANGQLTIGPIPLGTFYMAARVANFGRVFYPNTQDPAAAQPLDLTSAGQTISGITFDLPPGGNISGIAQLDTGDPAFAALIEVYEPENTEPVATSAVFNFDGSYTVEGIPPGNYIVRADPSFVYPEYAPEYYNDKPTAESADIVTVIADQTTTGIDFSLSQAGAISGTVTVEAAGSYDYFFIISAYDASDSLSEIRFTFAEEGTEYTLGGMPPGDYKVALFGIPFPIIPIYYDDALSFEDGDIVTVVGTGTTSGIDFNLPARGTIEGTVSLATLGPDIIDVVDFVIAYPEELPLEGDVEAFAYMFPIPVEENGDYAISGLPTGDYRVWAATDVSEYGEFGYAPEYYGGAYNFYDAELVSVTEGSTTSNIDIELDKEAIVEGFINLPGGSPASDEEIEVMVIAFDAGNFGPVGFANIEDAPIFMDENNTFSGGYRIKRLPARDIKIAAVPVGYDANVTYYGGGHTFDQGSTITLVAGQQYTGDVNIQLEASSQTISGRVTTEDGEPLNYVMVTSYDLTGHISGMSLSGFDMSTYDEWAPGRYEIESVAGGSSHYVRTWSLFAWVEYILLNEGAEVIPSDEWYNDLAAPLLPLEYGLYLPYGYYYFFGYMPYQEIPRGATQVSAGSRNIDFILGYQGLAADDILPLQTDLAVIETWPNPASNIVTLQLNRDYSEGLHVELVDLAGRRVHRIDGPVLPASDRIDVTIPSELASGIYAIRVSNGEGFVAGHRLVILR